MLENVTGHRVPSVPQSNEERLNNWQAVYNIGKHLANVSTYHKEKK